MRGPRNRARGRAALGAAVVVLAGTGVGVAFASGLILHDRATPASVRDAVHAFRARGTAPRPGEGVYSYTTRGFESLRVMVHARHAYPATTAVTAVRSACGVRLTWQPLVERSTTWLLCRHGGGRVLRRTAESHRFFGTHDRVDYRCDVLLGGVAASPFTCRAEHDLERVSVRALGSARLRIGADAVDARHYRTVGRVGGRDTGVETVEWWFAPALDVPVRIALRSRTARSVAIGRARYVEDVTLTLASLTPSR